MAIRIGVYYWLCIIFAALSFAAFDSFVQWGTVPSGEAFSGASFLNPSSLVDLGFQATKPIDDALKRMGWLTGAWLTTYVVYSIAKYVIILAFAFVALHLIMTIIEFQFSVMIGMVLFPWGILAQTAFLSEFALSWIIAGLIRVFLTVAIMAVAVPLVKTMDFTLQQGWRSDALFRAHFCPHRPCLCLPGLAPAQAGRASRGQGDGLSDGRRAAGTGRSDGRAGRDDRGRGGGADWRTCRARARVACCKQLGEGPRVDEMPLSVNGNDVPYLARPTGEVGEAALTARIAAAYEEARRRDTALEVRLYHAHVREVALLVLLLGLGVVLGWVFAGRMHVHAFVQVVQVDDANKVYLLGEPQAVLTYTPPEGLWLDMLGEWVRKVRWRGVDAELARQEWRWAYMHSCKDARAMLQHLEDTEKPFSLGKRKVAVQVKSVTKSEVPRAYTVLWDETIVEQAREARVERWTGTFSVGRLPALSLDTALYNRLGLCVSAFNLSMMP